MGGEPADPAVFPSADAVLNPRVHPVGRRRCSRAGRASRAARRAVATPIRSDARRSWVSNRLSWAPGCRRSRRTKTRIECAAIAGELVSVRAFAQQPGQLGDVRFLDPAPRMPAGAGPRRRHRSGVRAPPRADRWRSARPAAGRAGSRRARGRPAPSRPSQAFIAAAGGQLIQAGDQSAVVAPAPSAVTISQPPQPNQRQRGDRVTEHLQVIRGRVRPGAAPAASSRPAARRCYRSTRATGDGRSP